MKTKLVITLALVLSLNVSVFAGGHNKTDIRIPMGDATPGNFYPVNTNPTPVPFFGKLLEGAFVTDSIVIGPEILTGNTGFYDYKTNGEVNHHIQVTPGTPDNIQAVDMQTDSTDPTGATLRRTKYAISTDAGNTWQYVVDVPTNKRSGYPVLDLLNGQGVIANHSAFVGTSVDAYLYVDPAPLAGSFTEYAFSTHSPWAIWPQIATLSNGNVMMLTRRNPANTTQDVETLYVNIWNGTALQSRSPLYFTSNSYQGTVGSNMQYDLASNGAGVVTAAIFPVLQNDTLFAAKMFTRTSTDNGATWGPVTTVYTPHMVGSDPYGSAGGIDLVYKPNSTSWFLSHLETKDSLGSLFYEDTRLLVTRSDGQTFQVTNVAGVNATTTYALPMAFVWNIDNPALGWSRDGRLLYCVYTVVKSDLGSSGYNERDLYLQYSSDDAATWSQPIQITSTTGIDECYPSISIYNKGNAAAGETYEINMTYIKDPGVGPSSFNGTGGLAPSSRNYQIYRKISFNGPIGIHNIGTAVPKVYNLNQNYPNPFNPSTKIQFDLPKSSFVTLKVYDITGRLISTLVNENLTAGSKEYEWNAVNLPSGVYFYRINAGTFTSTKKMILVK